MAEGYVAKANNASASVGNSGWIIDSGATDHISNDENSFSSLTYFDSPRLVKLGDFNALKAIGIGNVNVLSNVENVKKNVELTNVLFVPGLRRKVISIGAATANGCKGEIYGDRIFLKNRRGSIIIEARKTGNLYKAVIEEVDLVVEDEISGMNTEQENQAR